MTPTTTPNPATLTGSAGRMATAVTAQYQLPVELTTVAALGVLSAATRGRWRVQAGPGWTESLALYTAGLAEPGTRKSAVLRDLTAPIVAREWELEDETAAAHVRARVGREIATRRLDIALETATHGSDAERGPAAEEAIAIRRRMDAMGEPRRVQLWFAGATPEGLLTLLAGQGGAGAHFGDGELLRSMGGGRGAWSTPAGLELLLKAYNGDPLRVHRVDRPSVELGEPFLAIGLLAQPEVVAEAVRNPAILHRGLLARFLFAVAGPVLGTRGTDAPDVPDEVAAGWDTTVRGILDVALAAEAVTELELTPEAGEVFTAFRTGWEPRLHPETGDLAVISSWASKHPGRVVRIAALLALADDPGTTAVGVEHVRAAVGLAETHAAAARAVLAGGTEGSRA